MHPAYYPTNTPNAAILARAVLVDQLKELLNHYKFLNELVEKYYPSGTLEQGKIFIAQMFLGGSYEFIVSFLGRTAINQRRKLEPLLNFLYHCRNAAFHGNKFYFKEWIKQEFRDGAKATWKNHIIQLEDEGGMLFTQKLITLEVVDLITDIKKLF